MILFSSYDIGTMMFMSVVIFSVKFWTVLWAIAHWLDNHLITSLQSVDWFRFDLMPHSTAEVMINFVTGGLFIVLPIFWSGLLGWAGFRVGSEINNLTNEAYGQAKTSGAVGANKLKGVAGNVGKSSSNKK